MTVKTTTPLEATERQRTAYVSALADVFRAAGTTIAISMDAAEEAAAIAQAWHDGRHDKLQAMAERASKKLREIRRRARSRQGITVTTSVEARPRRPEPEGATATPCLPGMEPPDDGQAEGTVRSGAYRVFRVTLRAASASRVGADSPEQAIAIAAADLPNHVTYARVVAQKEIL